MGRFLDYARNSGEVVPNATETEDGFMSAEDKQKLNSGVTNPVTETLYFNATSAGGASIQQVDTGQVLADALVVAGADRAAALIGGTTIVRAGDGAGGGDLILRAGNASLNIGGYTSIDGGSGALGGQGVRIAGVAGGPVLIGGGGLVDPMLTSYAASFSQGIYERYEVPEGLPTSGAVTIDLTTGAVIVIKANGNLTGTFPFAPANYFGGPMGAGYGFRATLLILQDSTGGWKMTFPANCRLQGGNYTPGGANAIDRFDFLWAPLASTVPISGTSCWLVTPYPNY
jgi:hypothetical protein